MSVSWRAGGGQDKAVGGIKASVFRRPQRSLYVPSHLASRLCIPDLTPLSLGTLFSFPSFTMHTIVYFAVASAVCLQYQFYFYIHSGCFFNSPCSSIHLAYSESGSWCWNQSHQSPGENTPSTACCLRTHTFTHTFTPCCPHIQVSGVWEETAVPWKHHSFDFRTYYENWCLKGHHLKTHWEVEMWN